MKSEGIKIKIKDIRPDGIEVSGQLEAEYIGLTEEDYLHFIKPVEVAAFVERVDDTVLAKIHVKSRYVSFCARSLERIERDWTQNFRLDFPIDRTKEYIDMSEDIRQEIIINLPVRLLSDAEMEKDRLAGQEEDHSAGDSHQEDREEKPKTYQPFKDLKDIEE